LFNIFKAVEDFHKKYNAGINQPIDEDSLALRNTLILEESVEASEEMCNSFGQALRPVHVDKEALTKELADILYVTVGAAVYWGLPLEETFKRVHESNMTKELGNKRDDGKILKGDNYEPPVLRDLFEGVH